MTALDQRNLGRWYAGHLAEFNLSQVTKESQKFQFEHIQRILENHNLFQNKNLYRYF